MRNKEFLIKILLTVKDLEGCSPLQPRDENIVPIGVGGAEGPGRPSD